MFPEQPNPYIYLCDPTARPSYRASPVLAPEENLGIQLFEYYLDIFESNKYISR
jgi:hypothetical protein